MTSIVMDKYSGVRMRVRIKDSRILDGKLSVADPFGNLLLSDTHEHSQDVFDGSKPHVREVGLVSIPRDEVVSVGVDPHTHEHLSNA